MVSKEEEKIDLLTWEAYGLRTPQFKVGPSSLNHRAMGHTLWKHEFANRWLA